MDITSFPRTPRLVNRFKLGADPEFILNGAQGEYLYAENFGLTTLQAFGCDMAGRQAEIRAYPSRFAIRVIASMVDTLRWMAVAHPTTLECIWNATAYNGKDGCGGHIHFGRKRGSVAKDVAVLDYLAATLSNTGIFNTLNFRRRQTNTHYGQYHDFRVQSHGYEYRTLPTQLSGVWLAYFTLVLGKLAVYEGIKQTSYMTLVNKYKCLDDDAAITHRAMNIHGLPVDRPDVDFKNLWGVPLPPVPVFDRERHFFPSVIKPSEETCLEVFDYLTKGIPVPNRVPPPTWHPYFLPKEFRRVEVQAHSLGHLPDTCMDIISKRVFVKVKLGDSFRILSNIPLPKAEIREALGMPVVFTHVNQLTDYIIIEVPTGFNKSLAQCKLLNKILSEGSLFPTCKAENVDEVEFSKWEDPAKIAPIGAPIDRVIAVVQGTAVVKPRRRVL